MVPEAEKCKFKVLESLVVCGEGLHPGPQWLLERTDTPMSPRRAIMSFVNTLHDLMIFPNYLMGKYIFDVEYWE